MSGRGRILDTHGRRSKVQRWHRAAEGLTLPGGSLHVSPSPRSHPALTLFKINAISLTLIETGEENTQEHRTVPSVFNVSNEKSMTCLTQPDVHNDS